MAISHITIFQNPMLHVAEALTYLHQPIDLNGVWQYTYHKTQNDWPLHEGGICPSGWHPTQRNGH